MLKSADARTGTAVLVGDALSATEDWRAPILLLTERTTIDRHDDPLSSEIGEGFEGSEQQSTASYHRMIRGDRVDLRLRADRDLLPREFGRDPLPLEDLPLEPAGPMRASVREELRDVALDPDDLGGARLHELADSGG